ncbi:MAG TPA: AzlC family ABC transporter permease [Burkholderiaceae bacterium]
MLKSGLRRWSALGMGLIVFAGSAQLTALPLIAVNAPLSLVVFTAMVVNLRFVIFSVAIGPHFADLGWRAPVPCYFDADTMMVLFPRRFPLDKLYEPEGKVGTLLRRGLSQRARGADRFLARHRAGGPAPLATS